METNDRTTFQKQKETMINDIALGLEQVINNMNVLNKNLEGVIAIGKEFENVSSLWKNFNRAIITSASDEDLNVLPANNEQGF
ncbi:31215_t:CDS:2 [Gigaspora margarita]|uniref:31215_t:CDS:1 n=2 Tax=Gigaspora margarita TaxID=4874 RepID=A0ABN7V4R7_GIGMA|nr:DASH complex subunit DAD1 [Gigaspora margarita]CAG8724779.1 31215_t:CDS:2 [Gigaspora margarita]